MQDSEEDLVTRDIGKAMVFAGVMVLSGLLLWVAVELILRRQIVFGSLAGLGSAAFWWPLFKLGRYHARRR